MFFECSQRKNLCQVERNHISTTYSSMGSDYDEDKVILQFIETLINADKVISSSIFDGDVSSSQTKVFKYYAKYSTEEHMNKFGDGLFLENKGEKGFIFVVHPSNYLMEIAPFLCDYALFVNNNEKKYLKPSFFKKFKYRKLIKRYSK